MNGEFETQLAVGAGRLPQSGSIQHAALASALNSGGTPSGYFNGVIDEARIWNHARTQAEIRGDMFSEVTSGTGLEGRWGLNEGSGTATVNSVAGGSNGTLTNDPLWVEGSPFALANGLDLGSSNAYVTFGNPSALGLSEFTIETWFRRDGAGVMSSTGGGGVEAIPLVTKGRGEYDGDNRDMNYFFGIESGTNVLAADFEEGSGGTSPGLNHPITGTTVIATGEWYHAAVTYDGTTWKLYLNGVLDNTLVVGEPPQSGSIQHAGLGTAMTSTGAAAGFPDGVLDEVRIWDYARAVEEIEATINDEIGVPQSGLVARWGLNDGAGSTAHDSAGSAVDGAVTGTGWSWADGAPFDIVVGPPEPPAAPTDLAASAVSYAEIGLTWTDNAHNETTFEIERSTSGSGGPFDALATVGANVTSYGDAGLEALTEYCYRVRAVNAEGASDWSNVACETTPAEGEFALDFGGTDAYVTFGAAPALGASEFTLECWFRRDGAGVTANTGSGGVYAVPLVTKGRGEYDGDNRDMNYFFGIRGSDGVLAADFEEGSGGSSPGQNHPIVGVTPITTGGWHHAAVTYDGNEWRLYLDGVLEGTPLVIGEPPQSVSIQHAALASALDSSATPEGYLDGVLDEVRIWNYARTLSEIRGTINDAITTPESGLIGRWSLNEGTGTAVSGSAGTTVNGTIMGSDWSWAGGAPFDIVINDPPDEPVLNAPADYAMGVSTSPTLDVTVSDPEGDPLSVTFYGRANTVTVGPAFSLIILPDTQFYSAEMNGGTPAIFEAQTQWIVDNKDVLNIAFVDHVGDIVQNGDTYESEWVNAWSAMGTLEDAIATGLPDGIPYSATVGNHDQSPFGDPAGTTTYYNQYFGVDHFNGRPYYGVQNRPASSLGWVDHNVPMRYLFRSRRPIAIALKLCYNARTWGECHTSSAARRSMVAMWD